MIFDTMIMISETLNSWIQWHSISNIILGVVWFIPQNQNRNEGESEMK